MISYNTISSDKLIQVSE